MPITATKRTPVYDLTGDDSTTAADSSTPGSPKTSAGDMALARKVTGLMDSFDKVDVEPQWKRRVSKVKKKVRSVMDYLTKGSDEEFSEGEEEEKEKEEPANKVDGLDVTLLPHQVEGLAWLLSREEAKARGGILADDVSLQSCMRSIC